MILDPSRRRLDRYRAVTHVAAHRRRLVALQKKLKVQRCLLCKLIQYYTIRDHVIEHSRLDFIIQANIFVICRLYNPEQDYKQC